MTYDKLGFYGSDIFGNTAAHIAAMHLSDTRYLEELAAKGADFNRQTISGLTPVMIAVIFNNIQINTLI